MDRRKFLKQIVKTAPLAVIGVAGLGALAATKPKESTEFATVKWSGSSNPVITSKMWNPELINKRIEEVYSGIIPRDLLVSDYNTTKKRFNEVFSGVDNANKQLL